MREEKGKYTPGPWKWDLSYGAVRSEGNVKKLICKPVKPFFELDEQEESNAHLIAAAPELLEALKLSMLIHDTVKSEYGPDPGQRLVIEAAIAKAEGR